MLLLSLFLLRSRLASAAPLQNYTSMSNATAPIWVDPPTGRGTWSILGSCLSTIFLCVWKSLHLNVPAMDESDWTKYLRKVKWVLIALLAPEIVVFAGFQQWLTARHFLKRLHRIFDIKFPKDEKDLSQSRQKRKFDKQYAMYAAMGGFIVEIGHLHNKLKFATLTTNGILLLAKEGKVVLPYPGSISDKSQMDILTKAFVCCQALSFLGQVIERKIAHLTNSLLELNTAVHIGCTVVMYFFWLRKPYNIQDPTLVAMDDVPDVLAFIVTSSRWPHNSGFEKTQPKRKVKWFGSFISDSIDPPFAWFGSSSEESVAEDGTLDNMPQPVSDNDHDDSNHASGVHSPDIRLATSHCELPEPDGEALCCSDVPSYVPVSNIEPRLYLESGQVLASGFGPADNPELLGHGKYQVGLSQTDVDRLNLAAKYMRKLLGSYKKPPIIRNSFIAGTCVPKVQLLRPFSDIALQPFGNRLICGRVKNWPTLEELTESSTGLPIFVLSGAVAFTTAGYGALHAFAKTILLPTALEENLWYLSCVALVFYCILFMLVWQAVASHLNHAKGPWNAEARAVVSKWKSSYKAKIKRSILWRISTSLVFALILLIYVFSRAFIIIESFISLRHLPLDVYTTPNITYLIFIPHVQ